jgi:hypothetical protein
MTRANPKHLLEDAEMRVQRGQALLLECTSGGIDQLRLAHWLGDKRRLHQLRGQRIAGISAHNDEWYPALLQGHRNFNSAAFTKTHVQQNPIRWFVPNQAHRAISGINRTNYSKPVVRNGARKTLCGR